MERKNETFFLKSVLQSFGFAINGIGAFFRKEQNSKIHLCAAVLVVIAALMLEIDLQSWIIIILCIGLVIITEMINSAIERIVDLISPERNEKAGAIKDIAAGAVLIAALISTIAGFMVFFPYMRRLLQ